MQTAPGTCTGGKPLAGPYACRKCGEPVTIQGDPQRGGAARRVTSQEAGPGGHVAAPIDAALIGTATARKAGERL
jgi:hypothetical protein